MVRIVYAIGLIHKASELALASVLMLRNVKKVQNVDARLHFTLASNCPLTQVGTHYKSNQAAYVIRPTIASQCFEQKVCKRDQSKS